MKHWTLARTLLGAVAVSAFAGCAPQHEVVYTQQPAGQTIIVQHPSEPPPPEEETVPPSPAESDIWIRGAWKWDQSHWIWVPGHWANPNPGHVWVPGHWEHYQNGYTWMDGHWE
jgi:hypothetical protein